MSEGIQGNNTRQEKEPTSISEQQKQQAQSRAAGETNFLIATQGPRARLSALVVEVYDRVVPASESWGDNSDHSFVTFLQNLVNSLQQQERERRRPSDKLAVSLLNILDAAFKAKGPGASQPPTWKWDTELRQSVLHILETNQVYDRNPPLKEKSLRLVAKIRQQKPDIASAVKMDPFRSNDNGLSGRLSRAVADRVSPTDGPDPYAGVFRILADVGPACTRNANMLRETIREVSESVPTSNGTKLDEAGVAHMIYFFSDVASRPSSDLDKSGLSSSLLGSILQGRGNDNAETNGWNLKVASEVLSTDYASCDWSLVASKWDFADFQMKSTDQFQTLIELYRLAAQRDPPLSAFTCQWKNPEAQCMLLETMLSSPPNVYRCPLSDAELADAATALQDGQMTVSSPNPLWASSEVLQRLLYLSDVPALAPRIRDIFVKGLLSCPEVLLCALIRLQLNAANAAAHGNLDSLANAGMPMKGELMRELIPLFFKPNSHHRVQHGPAALRRLWAISHSTVTTLCNEAWRSTASETPHIRLATLKHIINIMQLLPSPESATATLLNASKDPEFSIAVVFVLADNGLWQLKSWLIERITSNGSSTVSTMFAMALVVYISKTYSTAAPRGSTNDGTLLSLENLAVSLQVLTSLDSSVLSKTVPATVAASSGDGLIAAGMNLRDAIKSVAEACLSAHPSLRSSLVGAASASPGGNEAIAPSPGGSAAADDIEEMANSYFQKIYTSEQSIAEVVEMLKRFKTSGNARENDIFACMIHNLFDEYRFFSRYPEKELRITGILFGQLIQQQLVSSITLGIALRYVLEALRKAPSPADSTTSSSGKMFRFGMFALEQFKGRLHEWPQYCSHIVQIPHLKEGYANLVSEIEDAMAESQSRATASASTKAGGDDDGGNGDGKARAAPGGPNSATIGSSAGDTGGSQASQSGPGNLKLTAPAIPVVEEKRTAVFGPKLGRAVNDRKEIEHKAPPANVLDRVQFLINNVSPSNVEQKAVEIKEVLEPAYFGWLGQYLVVKRISTQPNFHSLYLTFLENLGEYGKGLVEAILASVYENVGKLLVSPKITTSTSERSLLKNLGSWLGQITLARNRPILQIMLDCKELLYQGYECGKLIAVTPFVAKILEGAKNSTVFRPPNPWVMGLLSVFRSLYDVDDLKMNIKFEVEVLCKNLGVKLDDIPPRTEDLAKRIPPIKEKNPDFNMKSSMVAGPGARAGSATLTSPEAKGGQGSLIPTAAVSDVSAQFASSLGQGTSSGSLDQQTVIPNLAAYVTINQSISQLLLQPQAGALSSTLNSAALKRYVPVAVDRAIREIIQPVVERSVNIACITTKEIVTKDFAMESDENKMRKAAQLMVANLAGSLALVTCREPLRTSVSTILRQLLSNAAGGAEKLSEAEQNVVGQCVSICATDNLELGCMLIEKAATEKAVRDMDEALAPALNARRDHREQTGQPYYDMTIFGNSSQRYPGALPEPLRPKPGGLRTDQLRVYEAFQRMPRQQGSSSAYGAADEVGGSSRPSGMLGADGVESKGVGRQLNVDALTTLTSKLDNAVTSLLSAAGPRAPEVTLSMLPPEHEVRQLLGAVQQVIPNAQELSKPEREAILGFSQSIFKRLYELSLSAPLRLEALVGLLEQINKPCPQLGRDLGTWAKFAPFETESQRKLHRTVLLLLIRSKLISAEILDEFLATEASNGRKPIWVEFSLLLIRTAFLERIAAPAEFPRLLDLMSRIADGRSEASPQVSQSLRKPILRMLEEVRGASGATEAKRKQSLSPGSSSLSSTSLTRLSRAPMRAAEATESFARNDPPTAKEQVTFLLEGWIRIHGEAASNENTLAQYLQLLQQYGVGKGDEQTERFLRLSTLIVVEAVLNTAKPAGDGTSGKKVLNYAFIDVYSKLVTVLVKYMNGGGTDEQVASQRMALLNKILGVTVRSLMWHFYTRSQKDGARSAWDQRPWFRLLYNMVMDLNTPDPLLDPISFGILSAFGASFHVIQPLAVPGFAFAWLELVSNRMFLPNILLLSGQKGWNVALQLLVDQFLFLEPHLTNAELTPPIKHLYEGTLRVLLVLLHDFPSFLAGYSLSICNVIPENCVQLRNIILSAVPKGMVLPDPFTPNLKIDLLPEIQQAPVVLSNVVGPIESMRVDLDAFLKDPQRSEFLSTLLPRLCKEGTHEVDAARVNSLVLYVGIKAIARIQNAQIAQALPHTPEMEILQKLMEFDDRGRYISLNAIANQLRYPSSHTHYYSCVTLFLFSETKNVAVKEQVTRVLLERLIVHRPHPWGLLITFIELIKNQRYQFWSHQFTRCATEIEKVFESVARSCLAPGTSRSTAVGGDDTQ